MATPNLQEIDPEAAVKQVILKIYNIENKKITIYCSQNDALILQIQ